MADVTTSGLDEAYEALRAWCHERPDLCDPSTSYGAFGTITAIIATLEHILELTARSTARATRADDDGLAAREEGHKAMTALKAAAGNVLVIGISPLVGKLPKLAIGFVVYGVNAT